jgi:protein arginine kinase
MLIDQFVKQPGSWLSVKQDTGIVISSRVRLARNVKNVAFPEWAGEAESVRLCNDLHRILGEIPMLGDSTFFDMETLDPVEKEVLKERHLISNELADKGKGSGVLVTKDEGIAIMVNEEDHLRLQAISPGMQLSAIWEKINAVDSELEKHLGYAFSESLGYLTACPSNVGTGLRASVMMHLSGLKLMNEIEPAVKGMNRIGLAVRGLLGEGTEAYGDMFQVSNQSALGESEANIIQNLVRLVQEVATHEQNARARLMEQRKTCLLDQIGRAYGILMHAQVLSSREAIDLMSILKLGVDFGIVRNLTVSRINEIILLSQPGHLQRFVRKMLSPQERDETRARIVRQKLGNVSTQE